MKHNLAYTKPSPFINARLLAHSATMEEKMYIVAGNVHVAVGYGLQNPVMIEGTDGVIVIDPGETLEGAQKVMAEFRKITDKPVKAVIISHSHADHWAGIKAYVSAQQAQDGEVMVIAHEKLPQNVAASNGQLADIRMGRAIWMYGSVLPQGELGVVNMGAGPKLLKGSVELVTPNFYIEDGEVHTLNLAGIELQIIHCPSETDDHIVVYLPESQLLHVADAIQAEAFPNLYTVRGQNRDAVMWYKGIDMLRDLQPSILVGCHMRPLEGKEECMALLTDYRDAIQYAHDQTVRLLNQGFTPDYIVAQLQQLPPHLYQRERMGEFYGTFEQTIRAVYDVYLGWFNGEPSQLSKLDPVTEAAHYVQLMGGRSTVLAACQKALADKEYQWCAQLSSHLIRLDASDMEARNVKAQAVRQLGYAAENATWRNWYLTCALQLEGMFEQIAAKAGPNGGFPSFSATIKELSLPLMMNAYEAKLNGPKCWDEHRYLVCHVTDANESYTMEIRRGVAQVHTGVLPCATDSISLTQEALACLMAKDFTVQQGIEKNLVQTKTAEAAETFFAFFDGFTSFIQMPFCFE